MLGAKRLCRLRIAKDELEKMTKDDLQKSWSLQEQYIDYIEAKLDENPDHAELVNLRESEEKLKHQQLESTRRENILVMRLTTKEQEMQEYAAQIQELKQAQISTLAQLRSTLVDPAVNLMFDRMRKEIETLKSQLEKTQDELSAWKFTPDSNTGKRLMAKCRKLHGENEDLYKEVSSGRLAKLEGDLALQKTFSEEMKKGQSELDEFLLELDEDVEGMQSTIYYLQQQLKEAKEQLAKLQKENEKLSESATPREDRSYVNNSTKTEHVENKHAATPTMNCLEVMEEATVKMNNVDVHDSPEPVDINQTEESVNSKPDNGTNSCQPWSPPLTPSQDTEVEKVEQSQPMDLSVEGDDPIKDQIEEPALITNELRPQESSAELDKQGIVISSTPAVITEPAVPTVHGSLHMEAYDSEQETESVPAVSSSSGMVAGDVCSTGVSVILSTTSNSLTANALPAQKKEVEQQQQGNRRTPRKRTRNARLTVACSEEETIEQQPTVKRLRRRAVVVDHDSVESEPKRTQLQMDSINDAEVQAAQTLANLASAKHDRKEVRGTSQDHHVSETVGNGELKGTKSCENPT